MTTVETAPPITMTESLRLMLTALPEGCIAVAQDPNDGELRAFTSRDAGYSQFYRAWASGDSTPATKAWLYTDKHWMHEGASNAGFATLIGAGWNEIPRTPTPTVESTVPGVAELRAAITKAIEEWSAAYRRRDNAISALRAFEEQVVEVATRFANDNDNRSQVEDVLNELDLEIGDDRGCDFEAELVIRVQFSAHRNNGSDVPDEGWVQSSMDGEGQIENAIRRHMSLDSDCDDFTIDDISFEISDARES